MKKLIAAGAAAAVAAGVLAVPSSGAGTRTVSLRDNLFSPASVTVKKGTTMRFVWKGTAPHNVHVTKGPAKFTSPVKTTGNYSRKLTRKGTYTLVCTIHNGMQIKVKVN
jgi:plastocyanin